MQIPAEEGADDGPCGFSRNKVYYLALLHTPHNLAVRQQPQAPATALYTDVLAEIVTQRQGRWIRDECLALTMVYYYRSSTQSRLFGGRQ